MEKRSVPFFEFLGNFFCDFVVMGRSCAVKACRNFFEKGRSRLSGVSFHRFPNDESRRETWITKVNRVKKDGSKWIPDFVDPIFQHGARHCQFCTGCLGYISGFCVHALTKYIKCPDCIRFLNTSNSDPCPNITLILLKSYNKDLVTNYTPGKGLSIPSGSVFDLVKKAEFWLRHCDCDVKELRVDAAKGNHLQRSRIFQHV